MRNPVVQQVRLLLTALGFLTRVPWPRWVGFEEEDLAGSTPYFPVVGLLVGGAAAALYAGGALLWPAPLAVVVATAGTIWLTGGFHEDGLADCLDGLGGGWDRTQMLAIMKDSRIGSYGAVGLILAIAGKLGALTVIAAGGWDAVGRASIAAHVLARWSSLPLIRMYRYVRAEEPEARSKPFASSVTGVRLALGTALAVIIVGLILGPGTLLALAAACAVTLLAGRYFHRRLGGITGDCLGAANQLVELAVYLALASEAFRR